MSVDYYALLGVPKFCSSQDEIRRAYLAQARFFHPDAGNVTPEIAHQKMQELNAIYDTLRDPDAKRLVALVFQDAHSRIRILLCQLQIGRRELAAKSGVRQLPLKLVVCKSLCHCRLLSWLQFAPRVDLTHQRIQSAPAAARHPDAEVIAPARHNRQIEAAFLFRLQRLHLAPNAV